MSTVWRWLSRLLMALLVPVVLLAAIWSYGRLTSPTPAQREAVALMTARPAPPAGDNGFVMLMALPEAPDDGAPPMPVCGDEVSCIDVIEAAPEQASAAIAARRDWLESGALALRAPAFRDLRTEATVADSLPPYLAMSQTRVLRAFDFATGQTTAALAAACEDALGSVRRAADPDVLIDGMLGIAILRQHAALIAEMRRRAPADPLPTACLALANPPDPAAEGTLCPALRGEWSWLTRVMADMNAQVPSEAPAWSLPVLHDPEWLLARTAERFAPHCGAAAADAARADRVTEFALIEPRWVDRVAQPVSVILDQVASPAYTDYAERQLDFVAQRRLLAAFLQMDAMDAALTPAQRFEALPETLRAGPRPLRFNASMGRLSVPLRGRNGGKDGGEAVFLVATPPPAP
jgi:hypothetical protein